MGYLVTTIYSGALHISPMRLFDKEEDAWAYYAELRRDTLETIRVYQLFSDKQPKLIRQK